VRRAGEDANTPRWPDLIRLSIALEGMDADNGLNVKPGGDE
jgi:hypothetical protein